VRPARANPATNEFQSYDLDALLATMRDAPDLERVRGAWWEAVERVGLRRGYACQRAGAP